MLSIVFQLRLRRQNDLYTASCGSKMKPLQWGNALSSCFPGYGNLTRKFPLWLFKNKTGIGCLHIGSFTSHSWMCLGSCLLDSGSCGSNWARMICSHPHGTYPPVDLLQVTSHGSVKYNHSARRCVDKKKKHTFHGSQLTTGLGAAILGLQVSVVRHYQSTGEIIIESRSANSIRPLHPWDWSMLS